MSPERRRRAVSSLQGRFGVSQRRACRLTSQHRSSQRYRRRLVPEEALLRQRLQLLARRHPRYGYRRVQAILRREGWACNRKRVQRLWREEGLRLPAKTKKRRRGPRMRGHLVAARPDQVWAIDFVSDRTADGRPLKILTVTDEHTHEALATPAARRMGADDAVSALELIVERRGCAPALIRCDNGPEFISQALRDWCRFNDTKTGYIEPGAPRQNPFVESSERPPASGTARDGELQQPVRNAATPRRLATPVQPLRPHQSLNYMTPAEYARRCRTVNQPQLS